MWPEQEKTIELLRGARNGDSLAVNRLLERHREILVRMVRSRMNRGMNRRVDASDIVQDALIVAHRRLTDYLSHSEIPFHLWLRQIVKDRLTDHYRHQHALKRDIDREQVMGNGSSVQGLSQIMDGELTPAANLMQKEFEFEFHEALNHLGEEARELILMRNFEHLTNQQVAEMLDISEAAAGMRYLRALRQLKAVLQEPPST